MIDGGYKGFESNRTGRQAQEEMDVDYTGDDLTIGFNAKYLQESLTAFGAKEIELSLHDASSPVIVRPTDDPDSLAVVMPMRL